MYHQAFALAPGQYITAANAGRTITHHTLLEYERENDREEGLGADAVEDGGIGAEEGQPDAVRHVVAKSPRQRVHAWTITRVNIQCRPCSRLSRGSAPQ